MDINIWDILDILITGYLIYSIYRLLKGSLAINIFIGVILLYAIWWLVKTLEMNLLSQILGQFVSVGVIIIIIIFQPEIRRFLLMLGNSTLKRRSRIFHMLFGGAVGSKESLKWEAQSIQRALTKLAKKRTGALILLTTPLELSQEQHNGTEIDAKITESLIESIFQKDSPLHDGAVIIFGSRIQYASAILPVSEQKNLPRSVGLRHRAAVGVSENTEAIALVVSEETGWISYAKEGKLHRNIKEHELEEVIRTYFDLA